MIERANRSARRARRPWIATALLVAFAGAAAGSASAREYASGFHFRISVPDTWLVLTRAEVAENADVFLGRAGAGELAFIPAAMRRRVYDHVMAGQLEVFYRRGSALGEFVDNVNVLVQHARLPTRPDQVADVCALLPGELSRVFGRPISMDVCTMRERVGRRALYLEFDGALEGTKSMQYQLPHGRDETLIVTATALSEKLPRMQDEFEAMIASIRRN
jgi:hypothetical protein